MFKIGQRHISLLKSWLPSASVFGATGTVALLYVTDWQLVNQYIPFYNTKFKQPEAE